MTLPETPPFNGGTEEWIRLSLEQYQVNAFRVLGLATDATGREIERRFRRFEMRGKLGQRFKRSLELSFLEPSDDPDLARQAGERLRDPEVRLIDEMFWLWPETPGGGNEDKALTALARGELGEARRIWLRAATAASTVARHNLAVLAHAHALDLEQRLLADPKQLESTQVSSLVDSWVDAYGHWRAVLWDKTFWERMQTRVMQWGERQIRPAVVEQIRAGLPVSLLGINAGLAMRAAEQNRVAEIRRHKEIMERAQLGEAALEAALHSILKPVRSHVRVLRQTAETLLSAEVPQSGGTLDTATLLNVCKTGVKQTESALQLLPGRSDRAVFQDDLEFFQKSLRRSACWFCQDHPANGACLVEVPLYGGVSRMDKQTVREVRWHQYTGKVPRCQRCARLHERWSCLKGLRAVPAGIRSEDEKTEFPDVKELLTEGWRQGDAPYDVRRNKDDRENHDGRGHFGFRQSSKTGGDGDPDERGHFGFRPRG
jgi:hypothetical protein